MDSRPSPEAPETVLGWQWLPHTLKSLNLNVRHLNMRAMMHVVALNGRQASVPNLNMLPRPLPPRRSPNSRAELCAERGAEFQTVCAQRTRIEVLQNCTALSIPVVTECIRVRDMTAGPTTGPTSRPSTSDPSVGPTTSQPSDLGKSVNVCTV